MNFKTISTILTILSLDLLALSSPVQKEYSTDVAEISINGVDNSQNITNGTYLMDEAETTDISSEEEEEEEILVDNFDEIVSEIDSADEDENENVCNTKECIEVSKNILDSMDTSADPCEDFYQFTCGNYAKNHPVNEKNTSIKNFISANDNNKQKIIEMIEGNYHPNKNLSKKDQEYDEIVFNKLKKLYKSCVDVDSIRAESLIDLIKKLNIYENKDKFNDPDVLALTLVNLHNIKNMNSSVLTIPLFVMEPSLDPFYQSVIMVLGKTASMTKDENKNKKIKELLLNIYKDKEEKDIDKMINSVIEFEKKLSGEENIEKEEEEEYTDKIDNEEIINKELKEEFIERFVDKEENNEKQKRYDGFELITLKTLNEKYPNINWTLYLEEKFGSVGMKDIITDDTEIYYYNYGFDYIGNLNKVLGEVDGETLSNYFELSIILNYYDILPEEINKPLVKAQNISRVDYCYNTVNYYMDAAVSKLFVETYFSDSKKQYAEKIIEYIKQSMINRIPKVEWLDDETIEYAYKKIDAMAVNVGYFEHSIKSEALYERYKNMEIGDNFFNNMVSCYELGNQFLLRNIKSNKYEISLELPPQTINAQYLFIKNSIFIPAGILQPPFFSSGIPDYINYGGIGATIGHEFTHAFDNDGKNYDMKGDEVEWWTDNDNDEYEDLTKCFINQYNEFYIEDLEGKKHHINGTETLGENIADNGGIARAYESWQQSLLEDPETAKKENQKLPGLTQYTNDQLFFISFGHVWCENFYNSNEFLDEENDGFLANVHSPGFARVNGVASNSKEFAKAFNCPLKSKMNPEKKCEIW